MEEQSTILIHHDQSRRAIFESLAELALLRGDLRLRLQFAGRHFGFGSSKSLDENHSMVHVTYRPIGRYDSEYSH